MFEPVGEVGREEGDTKIIPPAWAEGMTIPLRMETDVIDRSSKTSVLPDIRMYSLLE